MKSRFGASPFRWGLAVLLGMRATGRAWTQNLQPFSAELAAIQSSIAEADGLEGYYNTTYRQEETAYWQKIPGWMALDAASRSGRDRERISGGISALDVGCGYGTLLALTAEIYSGKGFQAEGSCLDVTEYLHQAVRARYGLEFIKGNVELDAIPGGSYDIVILTEVIEHFNFHPLPTLKKIHDALAPGGALFLSTPDAKQWGRLYDFHKRLKDFPPPPGPDQPRPQTKDEHMWMYSKGELTGVLKDAGFKIVKLEYSPGVRGRHFNIWAVRK